MTAPFAALVAWGGGEVVRPLHGGARSRLFLVRVAAGLRVLRQTSEGASSLRWLDRVHALAVRAGIAVPRLLPTTCATLSAGGWSLETWFEGCAADRRDLDQLTPRVRSFQKLARRMPPRPGQPEVAARHDLPKSLRQRCSRMRAPGEMTAVHGDLHAGNLLCLAEGRLALLDWEEARRDRCGYDEVALTGRAAHPLRLAYEIAAGWRVEPTHARRCARSMALRSGYNRPV